MILHGIAAAIDPEAVAADAAAVAVARFGAAAAAESLAHLPGVVSYCMKDMRSLAGGEIHLCAETLLSPFGLTFRMFVLNLSWQNDRFYIYMAQKDRFYSPRSHLPRQPTAPSRTAAVALQKTPLFSQTFSVSCVCPEPVLVNGLSSLIKFKNSN